VSPTLTRTADDPATARRRIALVAPSLDTLGGQCVQAAELAAAFRADGHDVEFVRVDARFPWPLGRVRRWRYVRTLLNQTLYAPSLLRLRRADVVHVFAASYASFLLGPAPALLAARALGKRVILNYRSGEADDHLARWGVLVHPWLRLAHEIVVPSDYLRAVFRRHGYRVRVIPNVVDTSRFVYRERRPLLPRLLCTRNLEPYYRVDDTLRAFALVRARVPEATLTLAGSGREEGALRRLAADLGVDGVRFAGRVERADIPAVYDAADIFVNSSVLDNQPVSLLEALAAGLPVVSTPAGDIPSLVRHGETGLLVPPREPAAAAAAVISLLEDPGRARDMARRGREVVAARAWPRVRADWEALYGGDAR
jgi:glycosyltransferase involved in cell wall biosynthesis